MNEATDWYQLHFDVRADEAGDVAERLEAAAPVAVTMTDLADAPIYEPAPGEAPLWPETRVSGLFPADRAGELTELAQAIDSGLADGSAARWHIERFADRAWERVWLDDFRPIDCGHGLWICPRHLSPPAPAATNLRLDPGLAFGTGTHPTTRLCLERLARTPPRGQHLIDYGCGSGILGIAALLLGAQRVEAVDIDPQALRATRDNAEANGVAERITVHLADELPALEADGLLANILAGPLVELMPRFHRCLRPGGWIVLSGILADQAGLVEEAMATDFVDIERHRRGDWCRITARRRHG